MELNAKLIDCMGNDFTPIKQARISYNKDLEEQSKDLELLERLLNLKHMVPFEHITLTFDVTMPVFVQRQLVKYRLSSWSEVSRRYTRYDKDDSFFMPDFTNYQNGKEIEIIMSEIYDKIISAYDKLIELGLKKEDQRMVLPVSYFTQVIWTMNMREFIHIMDQRLDNHQQWETREIVNLMVNQVKEKFPNIMQIYLKLRGQ